MVEEARLTNVGNSIHRVEENSRRFERDRVHYERRARYRLDDLDVFEEFTIHKSFWEWHLETCLILETNPITRDEIIRPPLHMGVSVPGPVCSRRLRGTVVR